MNILAQPAETNTAIGERLIRLAYANIFNMNILAHPAEINSTIAERLARFARVDPENVELLRSFLESSQPIEMQSLSAAKALTTRWIRENAPENTADIVIVPGSGSALDMCALLDELPESHRIFWMEADPQKAAAVFLQFPIETYIKSGRLRMVLGRDEKQVERRLLDMWTLPQAPQLKIFYQNDIDPEDDRFYNTVLHSISKSVLLSIFNVGTLICRGGLWQNNTLSNLPILLCNPGVAALSNAFTGKPALVVGAGPSLNAALPRLATCAKGFVIISTGTALRALVNFGIRPDVVVAVDAHPKTASQFQTPCNELYLVCSTLVYPPVPQKFKGVFSGTLDANPIDTWLDQLTETRGRMLAAGTVTSTALDLAVRMDCNPVVSIGFDLSLANDGTTHAQNTMYHGIRANPDNNQLVRVPGNYQDTVITTPQFRNYLILLEKYIAQYPNTRFINVTGAGAKVTGMTLAPTASLAEFTAAHFDAAGVVENIHQSFSQDYRETVAADLTDHIIRLDKAANTARRSACICNELMMLPSVSSRDDMETMERLCGELEMADRSFRELQASSFLLEMSLWPVCYWLVTHKKDGGTSPAEVVATYKRWREFYEQVAGSALWTRDVIKQVITGIRAPAYRHNSSSAAQREESCT